MAELIAVEGLSGSGKTTSLVNVDPEVSCLLTPNDKPLPFKGGTKKWGDRIIKCDELVDTFKESGEIKNKGLGTRIYELADKKPSLQNIFVEDFSHFQYKRILSPRFQAQNSGNAAFEKYNTFASDVYSALFGAVERVNSFLDRPSLIVVLFNHTRADETGRYRFVTAGKLLSEKVDPVSYMRIILHARVFPDKPVQQRYQFQTQDNGTYEAKSPMGMFAEEFIPNDMDFVLKSIRKYDADE